jgi:hypothetical protein
MDKFYENLKTYQPFEVIASELIKEKYNVHIVSFCNDSRFDFIDSNGVSYEVKTEPTSLKTGNNFVEFQAYGKPSGISVTQADYYIFSNTVDYYMMLTNKLKELVKLHGILKKTKDSLTHGCLIKCSIIQNESIKLK